MFEPKIKLPKNVYDKLRKAAEILGCSIEELAAKSLEGEADRVIADSGSEDTSSPAGVNVDEIANKLKGLGYLE